jgi:hypothetical protein
MYIDVSKLKVPVDWISKAKKKTEKLAKIHATGNINARNKFIDDNSTLWSDPRIKKALLDLSYGKCWYTEAQDVASYSQVEHFRPKKEALELDGTKRDGYWWRSFDPTNFRICGAVPNRAKACYFPLLKDSKLGTPEQPKCRGERPVFIDPTNIGDVAQVSYDAEGKMIPNIVALTENKKRVNITIEKFHLNEHQPLIEKRMEIWQKCNSLISDILEDEKDIENGDGVQNAEGDRVARLQSLIDLTHRERPFSGVARAAILRLCPQLAVLFGG